MVIGMRNTITSSALAIFVTVLFSTPAASQLVLSCYTLHNDLANFDRRARSVSHYFMPELKEARRSAKRAITHPEGEFCFGLQTNGAGLPPEKCAPEPAGAIEEYRYLKDVYLRSHLGGSDPVRLRIIGEMQKLGCPLPKHVLRLLELLEAETNAEVAAPVDGPLK